MDAFEELGIYLVDVTEGKYPPAGLPQPLVKDALDKYPKLGTGVEGGRKKMLSLSY